jgi:hypothetical protein
MKTYTVDDLFYTRWKDLSSLQLYEAYTLHNVLKELPLDHPKYGFFLIAVLRRLRKRPGLVDKITVEQAVDIYNDMKFLDEPWFHFPEVRGLAIYDNAVMCPDEYMARHTFDHFIYADNEFSRYAETRDKLFLRRLLVTIYQMPFDKESVAGLAESVKVDEWVLMLVAITFGHVRLKISQRCKTLLPKGSTSEAPRATGPMWLKIKHRLAETPAFQGFDKAGQANMYAALDYLEDLAQEREKQERRAAIKTNKPH